MFCSESVGAKSASRPATTPGRHAGGADPGGTDAWRVLSSELGRFPLVDNYFMNWSHCVQTATNGIDHMTCEKDRLFGRDLSLSPSIPPSLRPSLSASPSLPPSLPTPLSPSLSVSLSLSLSLNKDFRLIEY